MGNLDAGKVVSPGGKSLFSRPHDSTALENRLKESERLNKEYQQEIKAMQRIQAQQGKALESMTNETELPSRLNALQNDLRVQKEQNRIFRQKLYEAEKNNVRLHEQMVMLEETVRELRSAVSGKAMRDVKDKQQEIVSASRFADCLFS